MGNRKSQWGHSQGHVVQVAQAQTVIKIQTKKFDFVQL